MAELSWTFSKEQCTRDSLLRRVILESSSTGSGPVNPLLSFTFKYSRLDSEEIDWGRHPDNELRCKSSWRNSFRLHIQDGSGPVTLQFAMKSASRLCNAAMQSGRGLGVNILPLKCIYTRGEMILHQNNQ